MFQAAGVLGRYTIERPMISPAFAMLARALATHAWLELIPSCNPVLKHLDFELNCLTACSGFMSSFPTADL